MTAAIARGSSSSMMNDDDLRILSFTTVRASTPIVKREDDDAIINDDSDHEVAPDGDHDYAEAIRSAARSYPSITFDPATSRRQYIREKRVDQLINEPKLDSYAHPSRHVCVRRCVLALNSPDMLLAIRTIHDASLHLARLMDQCQMSFDDANDRMEELAPSLERRTDPCIDVTKDALRDVNASTKLIREMVGMATDSSKLLLDNLVNRYEYVYPECATIENDLHPAWLRLTKAEHELAACGRRAPFSVRETREQQQYRGIIIPVVQTAPTISAAAIAPASFIAPSFASIVNDVPMGDRFVVTPLPATTDSDNDVILMDSAESSSASSSSAFDDSPLNRLSLGAWSIAYSSDDDEADEEVAAATAPRKHRANSCMPPPASRHSTRKPCASTKKVENIETKCVEEEQERCSRRKRRKTKSEEEESD